MNITGKYIIITTQDAEGRVEYAVGVIEDHDSRGVVVRMVDGEVIVTTYDEVVAIGTSLARMHDSDAYIAGEVE